MARHAACEAFTTQERLETFGCLCSLDEIVAAGYDIDDIIDAASDIVYWSSGGRITGRCSTTVRPCADTCACGRPGDACGCCRLDAIPLHGDNPVVTQVKIDGEVLSPADYGILDGHHLIRVATGDRPQSWPGCQSLWRPDTEEGTFSITYTSGLLPFVAEMAATEIACDLAAGSVKGESKLPPGTVGAIMDGVSVTLDPEQLATFPWMQRLSGSFPMGPRPVVWSPEVDDGWTLHTVS